MLVVDASGLGEAHVTRPEKTETTGWVSASGAVPSPPGSPSSQQAWPRVTVEVRADGTGVLNGRTVRAADGDVRALLIQLVSDMAAVGKTPVVVQANDPDGVSDLVVWPDGAVTDRSAPDSKPPRPAPAPPRPSLEAFAQVSSGGQEPSGGPASSSGGEPPQDAPPSERRGTWYIEGAGTAPSATAGPASLSVPGVSPEPAARPAGVPPWGVRPPTGAPGTDRGASRQTWEGDPAHPESAPVLLGPSVPPVALVETARPGRRPGSGPGGPPLNRIAAAALGARALRGRRLQQIAAVAMTGVLATMGLAAIVYTIQGRPAAGPGPAAQPLIDVPPGGPSSTVGATGSGVSGQADGVASMPTTSPAVPAAAKGAAPVARAQLPALAAAPYGFAARPAWGLIVDPGTKIAVGPGGTVFTRTPAGALAGLDGATGTVVWTATGQWGADWDGPRVTRVDGRPAVAVVSSTQLVYWSLPDTLTGSRSTVGDRPVTVPLSAGSTIEWAGPSPAVVPAGGGAAVIRDGVLETVALPAGARVLAADGTTVIAVSGGQWIRVQTGATAALQPIPTPSGLSGPPLRVEAVGADMLFAVWPKPKAKGVGHTYVLWDTRTGKTLLTKAALADRDVTSKSGMVRQLDGLMTGLGTLVVDTYAQIVRELLPEYQVRAVTPGHVIVSAKGSLIDVGMSTEPGKHGFTLHPYPAGYPLAEIPFASISRTNGGRTGLVLHSRGGLHYLLGLPSA